MNLSSTQEIIALALGAVALLGAIVGLIRKVRPMIRRARATLASASDALLGREAIVDSITGAELAPALPGVGVRLARQEQDMELLTVAVTKLVDQREHLEKLQNQVDGHGKSIKELQDQVIERIAAKAESVSAWRAVEAVAKHVDPTAPPIEESE